MKNEFKSSNQIVSELENVKEIFDTLNNGLSIEFANPKYGKDEKKEWGMNAETILEFISECSNTFCQDIAKKALTNLTKLSEKQAWCLAYEFLNIKHQLAAYFESKEVKVEEIEENNDDVLTLADGKIEIRKEIDEDGDEFYAIYEKDTLGDWYDFTANYQVSARENWYETQADAIAKFNQFSFMYL